MAAAFAEKYKTVMGTHKISPDAQVLSDSVVHLSWKRTATTLEIQGNILTSLKLYR